MDDERKYVFIAGGIGITPFRSMIVDLLHRREQRDMVLFYQATTKDDLLFQDIFIKAEAIGLKAIYLTDRSLDVNDIKKYVSHIQERLYFISGSQGFVDEKRQMLERMGIGFEQIKTDLFTGYEV